MGTAIYLVELTAKVWPRAMRNTYGPPSCRYEGLGKSFVPVSLARAYTITGIVRRSATSMGGLTIALTPYDAAGASLAGATPWAWSAMWEYPANLIAAAPAWVTSSATVGFGTANPFPAGTAFVKIRVGLGEVFNTAYAEMSEVWVEDTTMPGVALNVDRYLMDENEWEPLSSTRPWSPFLFIDDANARLRTFRYSSGPYITKGSDNPPLTQYEARVVHPGMLRSEMPKSFSGPAVTSYGEIVLSNADGGLGDFAYHGLDGQPFRVLAGDSDAAYSAFAEVLSGTMQQAVIDRKQVRIRLQGRDALLDRAMLRQNYLGNNVLPAGLEGNADLAGAPKPVLIGRAYGLQPVCVNTARYIYQVTSATTSDVLVGVDKVWDAGVALTRGAAYASQAAMEATAPAAGQYREWLAGGCFRLGSAPAGVVTCDADATDYAAGPHWWWSAVWSLAVNWAGVGSGEMQFAKTAAFAQPSNWQGANWSTADQSKPGAWVTDSTTTVRQVMQKMVAGHGAWFGFVHWAGLPSGGPAKFGGQIFPPGRPAVSSRYSYCNLDATNCKSISGIADPGPGRGLPAYSVTMTYAPNHTVVTPSMAPSVSPLALGKLAIPYSTANVSDATVKTKHWQARTVSIDTYEADEPVNVGYEARRQLELLRFPKLWFEVRVALEAVSAQPRRPNIGDYVVLSFPELKCLWQDALVRNWGYFTVMSLEADLSTNDIRLTLRQATEPSI